MTDKLLIEALENCKAALASADPVRFHWEVTQATKAIAAHRSQQEAAQEPVMWCALTPSGKIAYFEGRPMVMPGPIGNEVHNTPLYTASPAPSESEARKPLTVQQMNVIYRSAFGLIDSRLVGQQIDFVRAIEAAHGITDAALSASGQKEST